MAADALSPFSVEQPSFDDELCDAEAAGHMHFADLLGRSQRIFFDGVKSDSFDLPFGVPQGSCLGPLLFVVYDSKLLEIIQVHLPDAYCFADDTQLYLSFNPNNPTDQTEAVCAIDRCISNIRKWIYQDKLKINDDKSEFIIIGSRQQLLKINTCTVRVGTTDIKPVSEVRNRGSWFDCNFSMSTHFSGATILGER